MYNSLKMSLSFIILFIFSIGAAQADCIVTTKNFSKSSRVIYVNPTNGSDQLAKIYNYNLGNQRNPYEPKRIVAFQNLDEALATRNTRNGDLVLIKTGRTWTKYDDWSQNKSSEFNKQSAQAGGYSQTQCQGENLTWVPSAVTDTQSADTAPTTEFANTDDITIANTEIVTSRNTTFNQVAITPQSSTSPTTSRRSSGGSSSGSSSTASNSLSSSTDTASNLQQNELVLYSRGGDTLREAPLQNKVIAELDPSLTEGAVIDPDVTPVESEQDKVSYAPECTINAPWANAIQTYPKDSNGWSIIKPDIETKIVYVSSTEGNDSLGETYNGLAIADPFNPGKVQAYKTVEKAYQQIRDGKPDWILLKKGDTFELEKTLWLKTGKSQKAHIVLGAYGDKNAKRPVVDSRSNNTIQGLKNRSYNTIFGIEFYASAYDPSSPNFIGWGNKGITAFTNLASNVDGDRFVRGLHFENNRFNYYSGGIVLGSMGPAISTNIVIRRNEILNSYSSTSHSQGMFLSQVDHILMEENILDHNGWYQQRPSNVVMNTKDNGYATMFNHNIYIENSNNMVMRNNLISRSSSIGMKFTSNANNVTKINTIESSNILVDGNLLIEGEIGISLGGNTDYNNGYRWDNIQVVNNVLSNIGRSRPTNRNISWGLGAFDWKSGNICGNLMMDQTIKDINNVYAIKVSGDIGDVSVHSNTIVNMGILEEPYQNIVNNNLSDIGNVYVSETNSNSLEQFLLGSSYQMYIESTLNDLQNNPYQSYFEVKNAVDYLKTRAMLERQKFIMKN